jgi:HEAT repeat protein
VTPTSTGNPVSATIDPLVHALSGHDALPPWSARRALEAIGPAATPSLIPVLDSADPITRWEAAKALASIADPASAPTLVQGLMDGDGSIRWLAAEGLIHIGSPALPPLLHALIQSSGSAWLRDGAHHVLRSLLNDDLAPVLAPVIHALEGTAPDIAVMPAASHALQALGLRPPPLPSRPADGWRYTRGPALRPTHGPWRNLAVRL